MWVILPYTVQVNRERVDVKESGDGEFTHHCREG